MDRDKRPEIVIRCNNQGTVTEVLGTEAAHFPGPGDSLTMWANSNGRWKFKLLTDSIMKHGAALDWDLDVDSSSGISPLFFSGCRTLSEIVLVGYATPQPASDVSDELMAIASKQSEVWRARANRRAVSQVKTSSEASCSNQLARLREELLQAQLELVKKNLDLEKQKSGLFQEIGKVVHGLRNPASGILSASEFMIEDAGEELPDGHMRLLRSVVRSSSSILRMIDDLLTVATIECGKLRIDLRPTDLVPLIKECLLQNEHEAALKGIQFDAFFEAPALIIELDALKFSQVMDNLLGNAVKFSHPRSRIQIRLTIRRNVPSISVQDEGPGISKDRLETIFHPFEHGNNTGGAADTVTGLGLTISKQIVEGHAGKLSVRSELGKGSIFTVELLPTRAIRPRKAPAASAELAMRSA